MQVTTKNGSATSTILVTGATGRHGGTGAYVARRLRQEGHQVRVLVRTPDERSAALEAMGCEVCLGDLRDRSSLLPVMAGVEQATFCFPVDAGIVEAAANFSSALRKAAPTARTVVMSMLLSQEASPSHLGRAQWLAEEVMARAGLQLSVLRVAALFFENILVLHGESIRQRGVLRNCFGGAKTPWIAGADAGELMVAALLHPQRFGDRGICYPPGAEVLSHEQIADVLSEELARRIFYEAIPMDDWRRELVELAERGTSVVNRDMAHHIATIGEVFSRRATTPTTTAAHELERQLGRVPISLRQFVRAHRAALAA